MTPTTQQHAPRQTGERTGSGGGPQTGSRRTLCNVLLALVTLAALGYRAPDITISAPGLEPTTPHRDGLGAGVVPDGARGSIPINIPAPAPKAPQQPGVGGAEHDKPEHE